MSGGVYLIFVALATSSGVTGIAAILAWFSSLALGHEPRGLRDVTAYALGYGAQTGGYALLLTGRYPNSDPALASSFAELRGASAGHCQRRARAVPAHGSLPPLACGSPTSSG